MYEGQQIDILAHEQFARGDFYHLVFALCMGLLEGVPMHKRSSVIGDRLGLFCGR